MKSFIFSLFFIACVYSISVGQEISIQSHIVKNSKLEVLYKAPEKFEGEIFQTELLIEVAELNNVQSKTEDRLIHFFNSTDCFKYIGTCSEYGIVKVEVNKSSFSNYKDLKAKIMDREITKSIRFLNGTFADLDNICN